LNSILAFHSQHEDRTMAGTFEFIDNSSLGPKSRRTIRSHVMRGKNTGKSRPRRPRPAAPGPQPFRVPDLIASRIQQESVERARSSSSSSEPDDGLALDEQAWVAVSDEAQGFGHAEIELVRRPQLTSVLARLRLAHHISNEDEGASEVALAKVRVLKQVGAALASWSFPFEITPRIQVPFYKFMQIIAKTLYPPQFCKTSGWLHTIWFEFMFLDEAYFHCSLALIIAALDHLLGDDRATVDRGLIASKAFKLLNLKLSSADALSDTSLASVISLCLLADVRQRYVESQVHFEGLCKMIEMRGGMQGLEGNIQIAEKVHRIDVDLALQFGSSPRFGPVYPSPFIIPPFQEGHATKDRCSLATQLKEINILLAAVAEDMFLLTHILNNATTEMAKLDPTVYQELVLDLVYRLLELSSVTESIFESCVERACHLGMITFLTTLLFRFDRLHHIQYAKLLAKLSKTLQMPNFVNGVAQDIHLWLLMVAGITIPGETLADWYSAQLAVCLEHLGVESWEDARGLLQKLPWVRVVHNRRACAMWKIYRNDATVQL
jgi:hypothetical protein